MPVLYSHKPAALSGDPLGRRRRLAFRHRHPRMAAIARRVDWFGVSLALVLLAICSSPSPAGHFGRAVFSAPFALSGAISEAAALRFIQDFHW